MTPVLFLPGMMCDARLYAPQIAALSAEFAVMAAPACRHPTMAALAGAMLEIAPPRFALAGLSMGGILAMEVLRQAPERVLGLALLDTNPLAEDEKVKERRAPQIDAVRAGGLDQVMSRQMIPNYLPEGSDRDDIRQLAMDMARALGPEVFVNQSLALRDRPDQRDTLRAYRGPSLVMCGAQDRLCPIHRHELMHDLLPNSELVILPEAAHLPTLEKPAQTTVALRNWLARLS